MDTGEIHHSFEGKNPDTKVFRFLEDYFKLKSARDHFIAMAHLRRPTQEYKVVKFQVRLIESGKMALKDFLERADHLVWLLERK